MVLQPGWPSHLKYALLHLKYTINSINPINKNYLEVLSPENRTKYLIIFKIWKNIYPMIPVMDMDCVYVYSFPLSFLVRKSLFLRKSTPWNLGGVIPFLHPHAQPALSGGHVTQALLS